MTKLTQKKVAFEWGDKQEAAFQTLKKKLCSAPILALPQGAEDFIVYCVASHKGLGAVLMQNEKCTVFTDHKSLQHILDQKELNMRQRRCKKERIKPLRVRVLVMTIGLDLPKQILNVQTEAQKPENLRTKMQELPKSSQGYDIIWVIVNRLNKSAIIMPERSPEFAWEREEQFQKKYPYLFTKPVPSSSVAT
ncbi:putative reverse transcriptase domain-containing protein [Tanacetum coccineum]|uniref:Reverse transcriptase domain-containing protein n=1 Tax=Tanacetum coccineum TaxID=301880 RepID=A0ABQ5FDD4_9ASTR